MIIMVDMDETQRISYMKRALLLARRGEGWVAPNPKVGAVLVKNNQVIGEGYHQRFGQDHAEIEAIKDCKRRGYDPAGAVMFVTLEPCCHYGKTGPCTEAIIEAQIAAVEIAILDEFVKVAGKGAAQLKEQGIEVRVGCCEGEGRRLNAGYFKRLQKGLPWVILKWAQSIDGKLAWPDGSEQRWLTGEKARQHVHEVRSQCGAIMVGIGTVLADDPFLTVGLEGEHYQPVRVVLDSQLRIPMDSRLVKTADDIPLLVYTLQRTIESQTGIVEDLSEMGCKVLPVAELGGKVALKAMLEDLGRRGVNDVLVEGGGAILRSFWGSSLADQVIMYVAPVKIGGEKPAPEITFGDKCKEIKDLNIVTFDDDVCITGYLTGNNVD